MGHYISLLIYIYIYVYIYIYKTGYHNIIHCELSHTHLCNPCRYCKCGQPVCNDSKWQMPSWASLTMTRGALLIKESAVAYLFMMLCECTLRLTVLAHGVVFNHNRRVRPITKPHQTTPKSNQKTSIIAKGYKSHQITQNQTNSDRTRPNDFGPIHTQLTPKNINYCNTNYTKLHQTTPSKPILTWTGVKQITLNESLPNHSQITP